MKNFEILVKRELKILFVSVKHILSYSSFFLLVILLFAFSIGPNLKTLSSIYLPILFMIILFSLILTSENFIDEDFKNGCFKELQFLGFSPEQIFLAKSFSMFSSIIFSNFFLIPLTSLLFGISFSATITVFYIFLLSSPTLVLLSLISALFSLQIKRNKFIQFIIVMPFFIPIVIFASSTDIFNYESSNNENFLILFGFFLITLPISIIIGKLLIKETNQ
tara:strand:- start:1205 stop:1867 length:663 start_codon:yes stop_codon:yes gene_type:complete